MNTLSSIALACGLIFAAAATNAPLQPVKHHRADPMQLGNFSVSLSVKDIKASLAFYEKLDFKQVGGELKQNWIILQNGTTTIGLFQGMFLANMLTFNPGWDKDKNTLEEFQDVRELQSKLKERGLKPVTEADENTEGPASFVLVDPDGNSILFDQHVDKPEKKQDKKK